MIACHCPRCSSPSVLPISEGDIVSGEDGSIVPVPAGAMWCERCEMAVSVESRVAA